MQLRPSSRAEAHELIKTRRRSRVVQLSAGRQGTAQGAAGEWAGAVGVTAEPVGGGATAGVNAADADGAG